MTSETHSVKQSSNSWLVLGMFWIAVLFQLTAFKHIWSIETFSRIINIAAFLLFATYALKTITLCSFKKNVWYFYVIPGVLVTLGVMINLSRNVASNLELGAYFGFILPWVAFLAMPGLLKKKSFNYRQLWRFFYYFIIVSVVLGALDYLIYLSGFLDLRVLETPYGVFLAGRFSLFHMLDDGIPHFQLYANFLEPGTLAMWLLPVIAYAYFSRKYVGLTILVAGLILTVSLGGWISLLLLTIVIIFINLNQKTRNNIVALVATIFMSLILAVMFLPSLIDAYNNKTASASTREENIVMVVEKFPAIMFNNPIGLELELDTKSNEENDAYIGSNFIPVVYFQNGGILAFFGYLSFLLVSFIVSVKSILRNDLALEEKAAFSSIIALMPFLVQRMTIFENAVFAFLWSPIIIAEISRTRARHRGLVVDSNLDVVDSRGG
jgi:hypothetical protein